MGRVKCTRMKRKFLHSLKMLILQPAGVADLTAGLIGDRDTVVKLWPKETSVITFRNAVWVLKPFDTYCLILFQKQPENWHFTDEKLKLLSKGFMATKKLSQTQMSHMTNVSTATHGPEHSRGYYGVSQRAKFSKPHAV